MTQTACEGSSVTKLTSQGMRPKWENLNSCDGADDGNAAGACQSFDHGGAQLQWIGEETDRFVLNMMIIIIVIIMIMKPGQREELVQPGLSYINSSSPLLTPMALSQVRSLVMAIISITTIITIIISIIVVIITIITIVVIIISLLKSTIKRFRPNSGFDLSALLHRSTGLCSTFPFISLSIHLYLIIIIQPIHFLCMYYYMHNGHCITM